MTAQKGHPLTLAQREARRRNGQKSTGPRTPAGKKIVSLNAVKHGMYSCPAIETMAVLGENPLEYFKLLAGLINSFHPRNPAEVILLEDIAQLHWQRRRNQIARGARIALAVERLELERAELQRKTEQGTSLEASEEEVKQKGLRGIADSPAKYREMLTSLSILMDLAKRKEYGEAAGYLNRLYGAAPGVTTRGQTIGDFFKALEVKTGASDSPPGPKAAGAEEPTPASELREWRRMLLGMLNEEMEEVREEWVIYSRQHVEITPALRGSLYAPGPEDRLLLREQALVDGLLVRKYKVFLELQRERRRAEAEEGEVEWDSASLGLLEPEPQGGPGVPPESGAAAGPAPLPQEGGKAGPGEVTLKASAGAASRSRNHAGHPPASLHRPRTGAMVAPAEGACPGSAFHRNRGGRCLVKRAGASRGQKDVKEQSYRSRSKQRNEVDEAGKQSYRLHPASRSWTPHPVTGLRRFAPLRGACRRSAFNLNSTGRGRVRGQGKNLARSTAGVNSLIRRAKSERVGVAMADISVCGPWPHTRSF